MAKAIIFSFLISLLFFLSSPSRTQSTFFHHSKASYYGTPGSPLSYSTNGACGYGDIGNQFNGGDVTAVHRLFHGGTGCGACYNVWCTDSQLCSPNGVNVVATDFGIGDDTTNFILSAHAFAKLAQPYKESQLIAYGVVDVQYTRISCQYPGRNMMVKIKEQSNYPNYLNIVFIYRAGKKDITDVELWQEDSKTWRKMRKPYGDVWDLENPPRGSLTLRCLTSGDDGQSWVQLNRVVPDYWQAGVEYDTSTQLN